MAPSPHRHRQGLRHRLSQLPALGARAAESLPPRLSPCRLRPAQVPLSASPPSRCPWGYSRVPSPLSLLGRFSASLPLVTSRKPKRTTARSSACHSFPSVERARGLRGSVRPSLRPCSRQTPSAAAPGAPGPPVPSAQALLHLLLGWAVPAARAEERAPSLRPPSTSHHFSLPPLRSGTPPPAGGIHRRCCRPPRRCYYRADNERLPSLSLPSPTRRAAVRVPGCPPAPYTAPAPRTAGSSRRGRSPVPASGGWDRSRPPPISPSAAEKTLTSLPRECKQRGMLLSCCSPP
ncbi:uncharacterized protein LOC135179077 [Pogoniulus pusillus]|uniref:uncharacterized protein LOC135179077 n=1 Tax=Pogoniulus pusillus TaxID=488313 RepID=UPI0030B93104